MPPLIGSIIYFINAVVVFVSLCFFTFVSDIRFLDLYLYVHMTELVLLFSKFPICLTAEFLLHHRVKIV